MDRSRGDISASVEELLDLQRQTLKMESEG